MTDDLPVPHSFLAQSVVPLYIGGVETLACDGGTMDVVYPATGTPTARVAKATAPDVDKAVAAATRAQTGWARLSPRARSRLLEDLATALEVHAADAALMEVRQTGKTITEAQGDVSRAIDGLRYYAAAALMNRGETIEVDEHRRAQTIREPIGVI